MHTFQFFLNYHNYFFCNAREKFPCLFAFIVAARILRVVPENATAYEGENVTFECVAEGDPAPAITWHRNGKPYEQTGGGVDGNSHSLLQSSLTIETIRSGDEGTYECTAANGVGAAQRKSVWLEVLGQQR